MTGITKVLMGQLTIMFIYIGIGCFLYRKKIVSDIGSRQIASLLLWLVIPALEINTLRKEPSKENINVFLWSLLAAVCAMGISILISRILYKNKPVDHFAASFSNAGFIGIPLIDAALGEDKTFGIISLIVLLNILQSTYGVSVLKNKKEKIDLRLFLNPIIIGGAIGLFLFFTGLGIRLPKLIASPVSAIANMNAPLAMLTLGVYFARSDLKALIKDHRVYILSAVRLLVIPILTMFALKFIPLEKDILLAIQIAISAPVGANVAIYSQVYDLDYAYASSTVVLSTILSLLSLPLIVSIAQIVL